LHCKSLIPVLFPYQELFPLFRQHGESGLTAAVRASEIDLTTAEDRLLNFLSTNVPKGMCPLAGNSVGQDARFLYRHMPRIMEHLHYRVVDVSTVKELVKRWQPKLLQSVPQKNSQHRALDDIRESVEELKFYQQHFFKIDS